MPSCPGADTRCDRANGLFTLMTTSASGAPAVDPSYASTRVCGGRIVASAGATAGRVMAAPIGFSAAEYGLVVEVEQAGVGVVGLLQDVVCSAVVQLPEAVALVESRAVQGLSPAEVVDEVLDELVVVGRVV